MDIELVSVRKLTPDEINWFNHTHAQEPRMLLTRRVATASLFLSALTVSSGILLPRPTNAQVSIVVEGMKYLFEKVVVPNIVPISNAILSRVSIGNHGEEEGEQELIATLLARDGNAEDNAKKLITVASGEVHKYEVRNHAKLVGDKTIRFETFDDTSSHDIEITEA